MTYEQALDFIAAQVRVGKHPALDRISGLLERMGNPQDRLRFVHVGGTNGKGTTCTLIASVLQESGCRTGLYTSPYVVDFRERFQINGEMIPKEELTAVLEKIMPFVEEMRGQGSTFGQFEIITALAFQWFLDQQCDVVVLEVGIGGRFDATNVIRVPEAAVITSISKDHTKMLGDTIAKIAYEKAGIIKPGGEVVLYPRQEAEAFSVIRTACRERGASLTVPELSELEILEEKLTGSSFVYRGRKLFTPFMGRHQIENAVTAYEALQILQKHGFRIAPEHIGQGFAKAFIPARMEVLLEEPLLLLDGGHNAGFAAALREVLSKLPHTRRRTAVFGMMRDKDSETALSILAPCFDAMIMTAPDGPRAAPPEELRERALPWCADITAAKSRGEAFRLAVQARQEGSDLIVCGSFYLVSELRPGFMNLASR